MHDATGIVNVDHAKSAPCCVVGGGHAPRKDECSRGGFCFFFEVRSP